MPRGYQKFLHARYIGGANNRLSYLANYWWKPIAL